MKIFLTIKHWQLFILLMVPPILFQFAMLGSILHIIRFMKIFFLFLVTMILFMCVFFGWFYAMGTNLHKKLPKTVSMNVNRFKLSISIPVIYITLISIYIVYMLSGKFESTFFQTERIALLIVPLHLFSMFCMFYGLYFNAKILKSVELQKTVTFSEFAGEFFLLWFYPIGIWILQPRINRLFDKSNMFKEDGLLDTI